MPRLFTALSFPDGILDGLHEYRPRADPNLRLVARSQLHLTLHFLGEADPQKIIELLDDIRATPFELPFGKVGFFHGRENHDWIFWMGIEPDLGLLDLHRRMGEALARGGMELEMRPFQPHLTLARAKPAYPRKLVDDFLAKGPANLAAANPPKSSGRRLATSPLPAMIVNAFQLYQSVLTPSGPVYSLEKSFPLQLGEP